MKRGLLGLVTLAVWAAARDGAADRLVVYGPPGTGQDRRALAVVVRDDGSCASWDEAAVHSAEGGVSVTLEPQSPGCSRWLHIASALPRAAVVVSAAGPRFALSEAAVAMGSDRGLEVRATRIGGLLRVLVSGAPRGDPVRVTAVWSRGQRSLERGRDGAFTGPAPPGELVGVVARSGNLVGADALPGVGEQRGPSVLVLPSALAVPADAAVRTAAFVVATNARGQLSRSVPLRIVSDRGRLRRLEWLQPGLAGIALSASASARSVDLAVWTTSPENRQTLEIPVEADWPSSASIDAPAQADRGETLTVDARVTTLGGLTLDEDRIEVRCDATLAEHEGAGRYHCRMGQGPSTRIVALALIDGRAVPLASARVEARERVDAPRPPRPSASPPLRAVSSARRWVSPAAIVLLGVDTSGSPTWGAGVRVDISLSALASLTAALRYTGTSIEAAPAGLALDSLTGTRQGAELLAGPSLTIRLGPWSVAGAATLGPSWELTDGRVGATSQQSSAVRLVGQASMGPRARLGALSVGLDMGVRLVPWSSERTWREPIATAFAELIGGVARD